MIYLPQAFTNPWDLMVHAQTAHSMAIFEQGADANDPEESGLVPGMNPPHAHAVHPNAPQTLPVL